MMKRFLSRAGAGAAATSAVLLLAACGAQPYPEPSPEAPPPAPSEGLLGGPEAAPPIQTARRERQVVPLYDGPPPEAEAAPFPPPPPPPPPEPAPAPAAPPVVIAMAPIPNPPERPRSHREPTGRYGSYAEPRRAESPRRRATTPAPAVTAPSIQRPPVKTPAVKAPPAKAAPVKAAPKAAARPAPAAPPNQAASPLGDRATRLAALETALADAIRGKTALKAPASFPVGQPADVTLTVAPEFFAMMQDEAAKNGLSAAAGSANLTALLSGEGFSVTPQTTQSQPLMSGQPTEFRWTVTAQQGAKGLHADLGADLLGAGSDMLNLGSVQASNGADFLKAPRVYGVALLLILAVLLIAWLARGRSPPSRSAAARKNSRRSQARSQARPQPARPAAQDDPNPF